MMLMPLVGSSHVALPFSSAARLSTRVSARLSTRAATSTSRFRTAARLSTRAAAGRMRVTVRGAVPGAGERGCTRAGMKGLYQRLREGLHQ